MKGNNEGFYGLRGYREI